jgi:hypothetical protein
MSVGRKIDSDKRRHTQRVILPVISDSLSPVGLYVSQHGCPKPASFVIPTPPRRTVCLVSFPFELQLSLLKNL